MSNPGVLGAVVYEAEGAFGENTSTFATLRLPVIGAIDVSGLSHAKVDSDKVVQHLQGGNQWISTTMSGTFKTKMYLPGHGSTTSGVTTVSAYETFLGLVWGNVAASAASGTTATGGTASVPITTASGTFSAGSFAFFGALNDARGGGQAAMIATHVTTTLTLLNAIGASPSAADVIYSAVNFHFPETSYAVTSIRLLVQSANLEYELHGCVPVGLSISGFNPGELPTIEITWGVAWWKYSTATFPSTVATDSSIPAPIVGGSLHVQDVGTVTRNARTCRNFSVDVTIGMELLKGPGGVNTAQDIVGARRTPSKIKVSWTEDADSSATTTPILPGYGTATTSKVVCWTASTTAGSRIAIGMPNVCISNIAVQKMDGNINRLTIEGMAYTGATTTSDLTLSALRLAFA